MHNQVDGDRIKRFQYALQSKFKNLKNVNNDKKLKIVCKR